MKKKSYFTEEDGLEIEVGAARINPTFLRVQFFLRILILLILLMAVFGLFGPGLYSPKTLQQGRLSLQYQKNLHVQSNGIIVINVNNISPQPNDVFSIWIKSTLHENMFIKGILPKPLYEQADDNKIIYYFKISPALSHLNVLIMVEPFNIGRVNQEIGIANQEKIVFNQFIYP